MFLKRIQFGKIKARGYANGRPQREYISNDDSSLPSVSIHDLMGSCVMDVIKGRKVVTYDIPGVINKLIGQKMLICTPSLMD